jgi:peptidoglycan/xylan/chitin deacetylase (PgdA/CDA1 family)
MIGVMATYEDRRVVEEFFELFKTPWEFYRPGRSYAVLLCNTDISHFPDATLTVIYGSDRKSLDSALQIHPVCQVVPLEMNWNGSSFCIFHALSELRGNHDAFLTAGRPARRFGLITNHKGRSIARLGYDLFREAGTILSSGQPSEWAGVPTLELHISILRELMRRSKIPFAEIPPSPNGYEFIVCLTHDIDFAGIKNHLLDFTMFGFLYRALVVTFFHAVMGKVSWKKVRKNLLAVLSLPAVHLGVFEDFWIQFGRYLDLEAGAKSTFFFLPYKGRSGNPLLARSPSRRASKYDVEALSPIISRLLSSGCEVALHGMDAWQDPEAASRESKRLSSLAGTPVRGVRIHWLYFDAASPEILEEAGLTYDSTLGYNDAIGFYSGTAQVFQPLKAKNLLELPLTIQDTAMFYSSRMDLAEDEAFLLCADIIQHLSAFGGVLVVNWHDRSLAPERLWGDFYRRLLARIKSHEVWFATGFQATEWFRHRRSASFTEYLDQDGTPTLKVQAMHPSEGPGLKLRLYGDWGLASPPSAADTPYAEMPLHGQMEVFVLPRSNFGRSKSISSRE